MSGPITGFKVFTHDLRSPIQRGDPVWDGKVPHQLPEARLDTSNVECAAGWNFCRDLPTAMSITGFWPDGRPVRVAHIEAAPGWIERGSKCRASSLTVVRFAADDEILDAIESASARWFREEHAAAMAAEQWAWFTALRRPRRNVRDVERGLRAALKARGLDWKLRRYDAAWDAWDAWAARPAWAARDAWDAWDARDARDAWDAWAARDARDAWAAWAARDARDAWAAWD
ncbi:MAG: hypothetical protein ACRDJY_03190, partial [Thermoleophilaceae bacterium]